MNLADLDQYIGADLSVSGTGDLANAQTILRGQQRILRRLLSNPGDYIFHPDYGAGLPQWIGRTAEIAKITALVRGQILFESVVAPTPAPVIAVGPIATADGGGFSVSIQYTDAPTGQPATLAFNVSR